MKHEKTVEWTIASTYMIGKTNKQILKNKKIAAFDMDHTLIKPINNKKFSETDSDWELYCDSISKRLLKLSNEDYELVIITNQKGISSGKVDIEVFKNKIKKIVNHFGLHFVILVSLEDDLYRKPRTKLWTEFILGNLETSFFCGDAAGCPNDFSDSDLKFALNVGIKFVYRDEFLGEKVKIPPIKYAVDFSKIVTKNDYNFIKSADQEVIINVGLPASGKSHFTKNCIVPLNYIQINQDILKTKAKCLKLFEASLSSGKSVVVDNTNLTKENRKEYLDIAKKYKVKCRCLNFIVTKEVCIHNSYYRNYITDGDTKVIPNLVFNIMNKKYKAPELVEGFLKIDEIKFSFNSDNDSVKLYTQFFY